MTVMELIHRLSEFEGDREVNLMVINSQERAKKSCSRTTVTGKTVKYPRFFGTEITTLVNVKGEWKINIVARREEKNERS